jgi:hypothetical protein
MCTGATRRKFGTVLNHNMLETAHNLYLIQELAMKAVDIADLNQPVLKNSHTLPLHSSTDSSAVIMPWRRRRNSKNKSRCILVSNANKQNAKYL